MTTSRTASPSRPRLVPTALACGALASGALACAALVAAGAGVVPASAVGTSSVSKMAAPSASVLSSQAPDDHRLVHFDARRDVLRFDSETEATDPAPLDRGADITKTVVDHQSDKVVVQARVRALSRSGYRFLIVEIATSDGKRYELNVDYSTKPIDSRVSISRSAPSYRDVECPDATWLLERSADQVTGTVPNSCLGDPAWIRVGVGIVGSTRDLRTGWGDDAWAVGRLPEKHPTLGPRQHRAE